MAKQASKYALKAPNRFHYSMHYTAWKRAAIRGDKPDAEHHEEMWVAMIERNFGKRKDWEKLNPNHRRYYGNREVLRHAA